MGYLSSHRGDYLGSYRGDPGFFKSLLKGIGKVAGVFLGGGAAPPPQQIVIRQAGFFGGGGPYGLVPPGTRPLSTRRRVRQALPLPQGAFSRARGGPPDSPEYRAYMAGQRKRKRMNVANPKALRRAIRRQAGFVKLAKRALKGSGYTVVSKGSRRPQRAIQITESGPGSVNVR